MSAVIERSVHDMENRETKAHKPFSLAAVIPLYNEEQCAGDVVSDWTGALSRLGINYRIVVLDDGSSDATLKVLGRFRDNPRVEVIGKEHSGHGPTILMGYRRAVELADWVFQCDGDDEMPPDHFISLWDKRAYFDTLFGHRVGRQQSLGRKIMTWGSRLVVRLFFAGGVEDVNTPYRLMRSSVLKRIIARIPSETFAPNVVISGAVAMAGLRIFNTSVPHEHRKTGVVSLRNWRLIGVAVRSVCQTLQCRMHLRQEIRALRQNTSPKVASAIK